MKSRLFAAFGFFLILLLLTACGKQGAEVRKRVNQLRDIQEGLSTDQLPKGPPHQRVGWRAEEYFTDPKVIALCKAIEAKDLAKIDELIAAGADVNARGRGNMTPLLWAFPMGKAVFQRILEHGADPNVQRTMEMPDGLTAGQSVTYLAAYAGGALVGMFHDVSMDDYLALVLAHGGNPNLETEGGTTPLFGAVRGVGNSSERIRMLLRAGADINHCDSHGSTAAIWAEASFRYDSLLVLFEAGADFRIVNDAGRDVVLLVAERTVTTLVPGAYQETEQRAVCEFLEKRGCDLEAARQAIATRQPIAGLPADQRPWLNPEKAVRQKLPDSTDE